MSTGVWSNQRQMKWNPMTGIYEILDEAVVIYSVRDSAGRGFNIKTIFPDIGVDIIKKGRSSHFLYWESCYHQNTKYRQVSNISRTLVGN